MIASRDFIEASTPMTRPSSAAPNHGPARLRCAVYTRKSSEEGLEQDFNSLDAQRGSAKQEEVDDQRHVKN